MSNVAIALADTYKGVAGCGGGISGAGVPTGAREGDGEGLVRRQGRRRRYRVTAGHNTKRKHMLMTYHMAHKETSGVGEALA